MMLPGGKRDMDIPALEFDDDVQNKPGQLSSEQESAVQNILSGTAELHYVYGVTGSGKTEVFLSVTQEMIARGKQVIYLVPEITLTHQLSRQVMQRFPGDVAILHSAMTPSQKLSEWNKIKKGEVHLVIGARSAVFAPCSRLGLIVIDEEHENSYKSGSTPRYHARQIALHRATEEQALVVMGSATPFLEAWKLMVEGRMNKLILSKRVAGGFMPKIQIVDIHREKGAVSQVLYKEMEQVLQQKKQVILFLNRRGFSYFFHCRSCGFEMTCSHCSVSLTYHKQRNRMVCHYCGYTREPVSVCPDCGSLDVGYSGFGTEMIEAEVKRLFPEAKTARLDTDSAKQKHVVKQVLDDFREGRLDILLGTQMVAKGLNFPKVELVGIILADSGLQLPDFRAQERTFSLVSQVAGRAGRYNASGKVVVQTLRPQNRAIQLAAAGDFETFFTEELEIRKATGFPPYSRMSRIVFRSVSQKKAESAAELAAEFMMEYIDQYPEEKPGSVEVLGPVECPINRIAGNYRWQILLKGPTLAGVHAVTAAYMQRIPNQTGVYREIDIDPVSIL